MGSRSSQCTETRAGFQQPVELGGAVPEGKDEGLSPRAPLCTSTVRNTSRIIGHLGISESHFTDEKEAKNWKRLR